jgi:hypothetical protein
MIALDDFLAYLRDKDVNLSVSGTALKFDAPKGVLSGDDLAFIRDSLNSASKYSASACGTQSNCLRLRSCSAAGRAGPEREVT